MDGTLCNFEKRLYEIYPQCEGMKFDDREVFVDGDEFVICSTPRGAVRSPGRLARSGSPP